ncbi:MAG: HAMP domain-containing histidine kinase [Candidatus Nitrosotenuis sp.]|nr:MAG: HAMP domain-containing histidine kinase [Candidatus Nitrosotenuis sp.]
MYKIVQRTEFWLTRSNITKKQKIQVIGASDSVMSDSRQKEPEQGHDRLVHIGELTSRITHDMRNPLTVIINYSTMIQKNSKNKLDKKSLEQLALIENEARKMYRQIEDVLNYVKLPPLKLQNHSLHDILKKVIENIQTADDVEIQIPKTNPQIICDIDKLEIVFVNLITNAVEAISGEGSITINAKTTPDDVIIEIEDSGPGIAEEDLAKVFEPLFTTKQSGTGLGLSSCKNIIERHRGTISVKNNPTTFTIKLPRRESTV